MGPNPGPIQKTSYNESWVGPAAYYQDMSGDPPILALLKAVKASVLEGLMRYTVTNGRMVTPREIAITMLSIAHTTAKKDPKMPFAKALALLMVDACRNDRELAHAAIDDAFDDEARSKPKRLTGDEN